MAAKASTNQAGREPIHSTSSLKRMSMQAEETEYTRIGCNDADRLLTRG